METVLRVGRSSGIKEAADAQETLHVRDLPGGLRDF